ncbi:FAD binding domain protein [Stachybotrys elegans]|uniref:Delta(24)-sterol reductase n=1 Tax=Stachybotrys elegans TaxID=80388 RepID=A0A8K0WQK8_9HYPO|nr:FAD binding domain protein [Stachybotrys elegans]
MEAHNAAVSTIASRVKQFHERQEPFRIYHGHTNSTRRSSRRADNTIDTSKLTHVLSVDKAAKTALVEPNVTMKALLEATLAHGLMPYVVMELPAITVGGGFSGTSGESSSFRYGAFDSTVASIEMVLPDGTVTRASKTDKQDLFWGAASAFGTLGVVTLLEMQLREARSYVRLTYRLAGAAGDARAKIEAECAKEGNDYVDGIVFSNTETVVCAGELTDELPEGEVAHQFLRRKDPWFYLHVEKVLKQLRRSKKPEAVHIDYVHVRDYLFRYDRGGFWVARYAYRYFFTPFNRLSRYILDPFMRAKQMYQALHKSGLADTYMVQDVGVPMEAHEEFQAWLDTQMAIYPLWLCPLRIRRDDPDSAHGLHAEFARADAPMLMNFGVWGPLAGRPTRREVVAQNRALEHEVRRLRGKKWLYAHTYYTEEEFWAHYDRASYDALRAKYGAGYLPSVYEKVRVDVEAEEAAAAGGSMAARARRGLAGVRPLPGLYGVYKLVRGGDYLLQKGEKNGVADK